MKQSGGFLQLVALLQVEEKNSYVKYTIALHKIFRYMYGFKTTYFLVLNYALFKCANYIKAHHYLNKQY